MGGLLRTIIYLLFFKIFVFQEKNKINIKLYLLFIKCFFFFFGKLFFVF